MHAFWEIVASNSLVVVVLAVGVALLGRHWKNPAGQHLLLVFVLLKLVTPPVVTVRVPLSVYGPPLMAGEKEASQNLIHRSSGEVSREEKVAPTAVNRQDQRSPATRAAFESLASPSGVTASVGRRHGMPWLTVFAWIWGAGIALFASGHACRILRFRSLLRAAQAPPSALLCMAEGIGKRLGLRRLPEVALLPVRLSPFVWSMGGTPRVFLPAALFERLDADAQQAILTHELAHVRRRDHWVRLVELVVATLFWWHPVVWWACRQLQELEEQCCDGLVLAAAPQSAKAYATALLETLDFLSDRSSTVPLLATAAKPRNSLATRITMLKNYSPQPPGTIRRVPLLAAVAAVPMAIAFAAQAPPSDNRSRSDDRHAIEQPAVQRRAVNRLVKDFPEKSDLSTPESAQAACIRAIARMDAKAVFELGARAFGPRDIEEDMERFRTGDAKDRAVYTEALLNAEILEVALYREDYADVISKLKFPEGVGRDPYSSRSFGRINGVWKTLGEDRLPSLEAARENFERKKDALWQDYVNVRDSIKNGRPRSVRGERPATGARIAPGEPQGISVEQADLMGRVEWAMMHGMRDITARKSIEWGEVQQDGKGNRSIRYKFYATIWDRDMYIMNMIFKFDAKGNIISTGDVAGFPQKKVQKPVNVSTQEGMKELVEDFFGKNFHDITSRETIEWGELAKADNGNASIRYKYRARIGGQDAKIMNEVFTFDPKGKFVSVKDVEGFPKSQ